MQSDNGQSKRSSSKSRHAFIAVAVRSVVAIGFEKNKGILVS
jgi:hypothetical protein